MIDKERRGEEDRELVLREEARLSNQLAKGILNASRDEVLRLWEAVFDEGEEGRVDLRR